MPRRAEVFFDVVETVRPDVLVVDRHPYGTAGELRPGLDRCRELGGATVLGLRDILDDAPSVRTELASEHWDDAAEYFDRTIVYGAQHVCDHEAEYGLPMKPLYVGWVMEHPGLAPAPDVDDHLLVVAAGGGADGAAVRRVGTELIRANRSWRGVTVAGPAAAEVARTCGQRRMTVVGTVDSCRSLLGSAGACVQMAGYNTTMEALASGLRPMLVPRRAPRREQAIRASRLASLGLADLVDEAADPTELSWLLRRPRRVSAQALDEAGIDLRGAERTAKMLTGLAGRIDRPALAVAG